MPLRPRPTGRRRPLGFTLIELLVAITLFGLLVTLGLPSFVTWIRNAQVRSVAESLANGLRTAQAEAVRRNRSVVIAFTNSVPAAATATNPNPYAAATATVGGSRWWLQTVPQYGETTADYITGGTIVDGGATVAIANDRSARSLCFNSNGRLMSKTSITGVASAACDANRVRFTVSQPRADRPLQVVVQVGGQIRLCDPNRPVYSAASLDGCPP